MQPGHTWTAAETPSAPDGVTLAAIALAVLFWSGNFIAGRALGGSGDPVLLNLLRWLLCSVLLLPLVGRRLLQFRPVIQREWRLILLLGSLLAALLLGEAIALPQFCGAACVFAGIALTNRSPSRGARK